jgi:hypothetical protein
MSSSAPPPPKWYPVLVAARGGLLAHAEPGDFVVAQDLPNRGGAKRFTRFPGGPAAFAAWHCEHTRCAGADDFNAAKHLVRCFYEVVSLDDARPYLDIDMPRERVPVAAGAPAGAAYAAARSAVASIAAAAEAVFAPLESARALVCTSIPAAPRGASPAEAAAAAAAASKFSFHIIVDGVRLRGVEEHAAFADAAIAASRAGGVPEFATAAIDTGVYHSIQMFRMLWSHKWVSAADGAPRVKTFDAELSRRWRPRKHARNIAFAVFEATCLSQVASCDFPPRGCKVVVLAESRTKARDARAAALLARRPAAAADAGGGACCGRGEAAAALAFVAERFAAAGHAAPFDLRDDGRDGGAKVALRRLRPSFCPKCQRTHEHENPFLIVRDAKTVLFNCGRTREFTSFEWADASRPAPWAAAFAEAASPLPPLPLPLPAAASARQSVPAAAASGEIEVSEPMFRQLSSTQPSRPSPRGGASRVGAKRARRQAT